MSGSGSADWLAGFGKADITPPAGHMMSGFVARDKPAEGVHDRLWARCLSLSDGATRAALVILDIIGVDHHLTARIRNTAAQTSGIDPNAIAVLATHTHGGPAVLRDTLLGQVSEAYLDMLVQAAASAVTQATSKEKPVKLRYHVGRNALVAHNRREPGGVVDPDVPVLCIEGHDGQLLGLLTSYGCHPVTLGQNNLLWTADYPGALIAALELLEPAAIVMFAIGCCGQINVGHSATDSVTGHGLARRSFAEARRIGRTLAGEVFTVSEAMAPPGERAGVVLTPRLKVRRQELDLPLCPLLAPAALQTQIDGWRTQLDALGDDDASQGVARFIQANLTWAKTIATQPRSAVPAEVMVITVGELSLVLYPGEMFVEYGLELKQQFSLRHVMTLAYANAAPGYIPHATAFAQGGYEVEEAYRFYGLPAPLAPQAGEIVQGAAIKLIQKA